MDIKFTKTGLALICGLVCLTTAHAQETAQERIISANERMAVLRAQQQELEVEAQIAAKQTEIQRIKGVDRFEVKTARPMPIVRSIEGIDNKKMATISYPSGEEETVRIGDTLKSGWKVVGIDLRTVSLVRKRERVRLYVSTGTRIGTVGQVEPGKSPAPVRPDASGKVPNIPIIN